MRRRNRQLYLVAACLALSGLVACGPGASAESEIWVPEVVARYPHDQNAFTQGLLFHEGKLYESTGIEGQSSLRRVHIETGRVEQRHNVDDRYFAEGLALVGDELFQLTWQDNTAFVYNLANFRQVASHAYEGEGWGLTYNGESLVMSDGTPTLRFIDPATFAVVRTVTVTDDGRAQRNLNELEYIDGEVWANIWLEDRVARIDPEDGHIVGWIDLSALYPASRRPIDAVVNGIAWDPESDRIFVTGKLWPVMFEIELSER
jgi:glutaminyl-peptide cyclotransferase